MNNIYKCMICGNIAELLHDSGIQMICCGQEMTLLKENTEDASKEKHVPVIEQLSGKIKVKIGAVPHPMEQEHFIQWIEVVSNGKSYKEFLKPGQKPEAEFCVSGKAIVREYCNLHGLWKANS